MIFFNKEQEKQYFSFLSFFFLNHIRYGFFLCRFNELELFLLTLIQDVTNVKKLKSGVVLYAIYALKQRILIVLGTKFIL